MDDWQAIALQPSSGVTASYWNSPPFHDEPKFYHISALLQPPPGVKDKDIESDGDSIAVVGGSSLLKEKALQKVAGEAVERYSLFINQRLPSILCSFEKFTDEQAVDPEIVAVGGTSGRDRRRDKVAWVRGVNLVTETAAWIPSQLVFVPHLFEVDEVIWRAPISTGAATGTTRQDAIFGGLCEIIERDAFMTCWLLQITPTAIGDDLLKRICAESELLDRTIERSRRYLLNPRFHILPSNLPVYTVVCTLWDETARMPQFTLGAKTCPSMIDAVIGALEEAHQLRPWMRRVADEDDAANLKTVNPNPKNLRERAKLWLSTEAVSHMRNWLSGAKDVYPPEKLSFERSLKNLITAVHNDGGSVFGIETTSNLPEQVRATGIQTAKVVVPEYQPLYLTEELSDIAVDRLACAESRLKCSAARNVNQLFEFPHPFL